jgi:hypothetical protein
VSEHQRDRIVPNRDRHEGATANCHWWWFRGHGRRGLFRNRGSTRDFRVRAPAMEVLRTQGIQVTGVLGNYTITPGLIHIDDADSADSSSLDCDVLVDGHESLSGRRRVPIVRRCAVRAVRDRDPYFFYRMAGFGR